MDDWRINLRLPAELKEPLKEKAKSEDRSVNSMILTIIKKYLEEDGK
jgi:predicted HicB family RNase H-like nuclease